MQRTFLVQDTFLDQDISPFHVFSSPMSFSKSEHFPCLLAPQWTGVGRSQSLLLGADVLLSKRKRKDLVFRSISSTVTLYKPLGNVGGLDLQLLSLFAPRGVIIRLNDISRLGKVTSEQCSD